MSVLDMNIVNDLRALDRSGKGDFLRQIVGVFETQAEEIVEQLKAAADEKNDTQLGELAHKLKGSARTVGAAELGDCCERLERDARPGPILGVDKHLDEIFKALTRARAGLRQQL